MTTTPPRYFLSYRGVKLPLQLLQELPADTLRHRNTYFRAQYDAADRLICCEKLVYGEVELRHDYVYTTDGRLLSATIQVGEDEAQTMSFAE